jgi:nucleoside 2-deoxyribosyltransferase
MTAPVRPPKIYLAAPFFDVGQRWLVEVVRSALMDLGAEVFSPLHDVGYSVPDAAAHDLAGLATCDSVLALLDGSDPGTVFECGWATDHGIPVTGFCQRGDPEALSMIRGSGANVRDDLSSAVYAAIWRAFT